MNSSKYCGLLPSNVVFVLIPSCRAAISVKILKVEPACILASVAALNCVFWIVRAAVHRDDRAVAGLDRGQADVQAVPAASSGIRSLTAATAASWAFLSIVVTIRRPPRSMSASVSLSLLPQLLLAPSSMR